MLCINTLEGVIYYQMQIWIGNKNINETDWRWVVIEGSFNSSGWKISLHNTRAFGNDISQQQQMMWCNNVLGLFCTSTFGVCYGDNCENSAPIIDQEEGVTRQWR